VAFKATSSSKGKAKKEEPSDDDCPSACDEEDDEKMALFVKKFGKFMIKKGYGARMKKDRSKKSFTRRCYNCKSKGHFIDDCPYKSGDSDDDKKKKGKKEKKEKKDKKMILKKKKKGESYMVTWDSDASTSDDDEDSDDKRKTSKKKAIASIAINNKPSLFDSSSCFMAKGSKVQSDDERE